jgi:hypothetical protein
MHPHRLKRALRQVRLMSKAAFEVVYPVIARGMTWEACRARIASDRFARGETPYTDEEWTAVLKLGDKIDGQLKAADVRLTMGGEPTFVSIDHPDAPEWNDDCQRPAAL